MTLCRRRKRVCGRCAQVVNEQIRCAECLASPTGDSKVLGLLFAILWVACAILFDNHSHSFVVAFRRRGHGPDHQHYRLCWHRPREKEVTLYRYLRKIASWAAATVIYWAMAWGWLHYGHHMLVVNGAAPTPRGWYGHSQRSSLMKSKDSPAIQLLTVLWENSQQATGHRGYALTSRCEMAFYWLFAWASHSRNVTSESWERAFALAIGLGIRLRISTP